MKKNKLNWFFRKEKLMKLNRIMRLTILMMVCLNLTISAEVYSQVEKFSIQKTNATVKEVFEEVMQRSNYHFFYNNEFDVNRKVSIDMKNGDIDAVVRKVLEGQNYSYRLIDNYVIIKREVQQADPQSRYTRKISGIVKDKDGLPLPGVSVALAGSTLGVATDVDGKFTFVVPGPGSILKFSFIGKKTYEVVVQDETYFDVTLQDDEKMLDEVVCTGIQTISRERATGSFELLNADELDKTLTSDVVSRLQGKVAGVQIGQNNKMTIRGRGSMISNTEPLVVVDGFPIEGGLETVNPDDIDNITILKDAAAASIWGVRAANGVVVITTKSGKPGNKPTLDVSYFLTVKQKPHLKDLHMVGSSDVVDMQLESISKYGWDPISAMMFTDMPMNKVQENYYNTWMKYVDWGDFNDLMNLHYEAVIADEDFQKEISRLRKADLYKQYEDELLRHAIGNRLNIALRGGSDQSNYYLSAVYDHQLMSEIGNQSNDMILNMKYNYKLLRGLTLSTSANIHYSDEKENGIELSSIVGDMRFHNLLDENGERIQYDMIQSDAAREKEAAGYMSYTKNLLDDQELKDNTNNNFAARVNAALKWDIIEGLSIETRFQYERGYGKQIQNEVLQYSDTRLLINEYTLQNEDGSLNYQIPMGAKYKENRTDYEAWTWRNQLSYNKDWNNSKHMLAVVLGHEMRMYKTQAHWQKIYGYDPSSLTYNAFNEAQWAQNGYIKWHETPLLFHESTQEPFNRYTETDNRDISVYMNAAYTFLSKYTLSASGRIDQSNLFGNDSDYKYNFIWSTGLSWRISEEEFAKCDWLDQLLLRFTYGIGGNVNKNFYPVLMGSRQVHPFAGSYIQLDNPANKNLTWEKSTTLNAGVDFALLNNRIAGSIDYYHKKSTDLLGRMALDPTNGFDHATMNFASLLNQGVEVTLNLVPLRLNDFTWNVGFNISYNKNKVTKVDIEGTGEDQYLVPLDYGVAIKDKPLGRLYAYHYAGLDADGTPMLWQDGEKVSYADYSNDITSLKYMGTTVAPWHGGLSTSFEYKGITLSANATYKFGHKFQMPVSAPSMTQGFENLAERWQKEGDETMVPVMDPFNSWSFEQYYRLADINVCNAAWFRLNEVALGYNLPKNILKKTPIKSLNVQFQIRNLCYWTANDKHIDPEMVTPVTNIYLDGGLGLPEPRTFILGIKASF